MVGVILQNRKEGGGRRDNVVKNNVVKNINRNLSEKVVILNKKLTYL